jgi:hypothetical protein
LFDPSLPMMAGGAAVPPPPPPPRRDEVDDDDDGIAAPDDDIPLPDDDNADDDDDGDDNGGAPPLPEESHYAPPPVGLPPGESDSSSVTSFCFARPPRHRLISVSARAVIRSFARSLTLHLVHCDHFKGLGITPRHSEGA